MKKLFSKAFLSAVMAIALVMSIVGSASANFSDIKGHWAEATIVKWEGKGFAKGYPDGTFKPDGMVTRAEFVAFVDRYFGFTDKGTEVYPFPDVDPNEWYGYNKEADISIAKKAGLIYDFGPYFQPDKAITRAEAAKIIARAMKLTTTHSGALLSVFADVNVLSPSTSVEVAAVVGAGIMQGDYDIFGNRVFRPEATLTRAEAITILDNINTLYPTYYHSGGLLSLNVDANVLGLVSADVDVNVGGHLLGGLLGL